MAWVLRAAAAAEADGGSVAYEIVDSTKYCYSVAFALLTLSNARIAGDHFVATTAPTLWLCSWSK